MLKIEPLTMAVNPTDVNALVGDEVVLCCSATGNPAPDNYEW